MEVHRRRVLLTFSLRVDRVGRGAGLAEAHAVDGHHPERVHGEGRQARDGDVGVVADRPLASLHARPQTAVAVPGKGTVRPVS